MAGKIDGKDVVLSIIDAIESNKAWLSEIDGAVGDGDHGVNMAKGMAMVKEKIGAAGGDTGALLRLTGMTLLANIGGAMGPIYGTFFMRMGKAIEGKDGVSEEDLLAMLSSALEGIKQRGGAKVGDKTLVDALEPAIKGYQDALKADAGFAAAIDRMIESAREGMEGTKELVAKVGRSSRLGERSKGTIDAGAASCYLILKALGESLKRQL
jgi:dihydroxyacetone kinase phosphoprotein-dependent L subunit